MATKKTNLSEQSKVTLDNPEDIKIAIVQSEWNPTITSSMVKAAKKTLIANGISKKNIELMTVPGTFELPLGAKLVNRKHSPRAIICVGCVIKGETDHDKYISHSVASALQMLNLSLDKPVIFSVLTPNTMAQAKERTGGKHGNKGDEAAITALKMIKLSSPTKAKKIGF
jgi:6,7-dimethyl-8-ribityllumazine synthase